MTEKLERKYKERFAVYTEKDQEVRSMTDEEFLNYSAFLMKQQDVHSTEKGWEALKTTKNVTKVRSLSQLALVISTVFIVALGIALLALFVFSFIYLVLYFRKDQVKRVIDFVMLLSALSFVLVFSVYLFMFYKMSDITKKIMSLM